MNAKRVHLWQVRELLALGFDTAQIASDLDVKETSLPRVAYRHGDPELARRLYAKFSTESKDAEHIRRYGYGRSGVA